MVCIPTFNELLFSIGELWQSAFTETFLHTPVCYPPLQYIGVVTINKDGVSVPVSGECHSPLSRLHIQIREWVQRLAPCLVRADAHLTCA